MAFNCWILGQPAAKTRPSSQGFAQARRHLDPNHLIFWHSQWQKTCCVAHVLPSCETQGTIPRLDNQFCTYFFWNWFVNRMLPSTIWETSVYIGYWTHPNMFDRNSSVFVFICGSTAFSAYRISPRPRKVETGIHPPDDPRIKAWRTGWILGNRNPFARLKNSFQSTRWLQFSLGCILWGTAWDANIKRMFPVKFILKIKLPAIAHICLINDSSNNNIQTPYFPK